METLTIKDVLRGVTAGRMQTSGFMQVIPLISDLQDERFVSPNEEGAMLVKTNDYGSIGFENKSDKTLIIPAQAAYITKEQAQDHGMSHAGMLKKRSSKTYDTAACVEQSQGGYISNKQHPMIILPLPLRETAFEKRNQRGYDKLWPAISKFNKDMGQRNAGHISYFLQAFQKQLDQFVAEFEIVANQVGAIILVDGTIVGVERTPSFNYWKSIWTAIIRECYGSYALKVAKDKRGAEPKGRVPLDVDGITSIDDLEQSLRKAQETEDEKTRQTVRKLFADPFKRTKQEKLERFDMEFLDHKQFAGQIIKDDERVVYGSFVTRDKWLQNSDWHDADEFDF